MLEATSDYRYPHPYDEERRRPSKRARGGPAGNSYHDPATPLGDSEEPAPSSEKANLKVPVVQRVQEKDKNRKLSCKECRRRVDNLTRCPVIWSSNRYPLSVPQVEVEGKATPVLL